MRLKPLIQHRILGGCYGTETSPDLRLKDIPNILESPSWYVGFRIFCPTKVHRPTRKPRHAPT